MKFKVITPEGPEYEAEQRLRWEVLSKPYGIPPEVGAFPEELHSLHLVAIDGKRLVGCICFHPETHVNGRIFEMAVSEEYQGPGFGRKLILALEQMLVQRGIQDVYLYAREESEEFYSMMGYSPEDSFVEQMGLKTRMMKKRLVA
jgi:ribosomal protein S18 acetylase RimI-like enzyme